MGVRKNVPSQGRKWVRRAGMLAGGALVIAACIWARQHWSPSASAQQPPKNAGGKSAIKQASAETPAAKAVPKDVAVVNGQVITRDQLATECLRRAGPEVLESLIHKHLIADYCTRQKITVSDEEVRAEIERIAQRFRVGVSQWLKMQEQERGVNAAQYANDIIWPTLALRKAAKGAMDVTPEELKAAHETQFGPAVEARMIVLDDAKQAAMIHQRVTAQPEEFSAMARQHSKDPSSASVDGRILPIRMHLGDPEIERVAFSLQPGEISDVISVGNQFVILRCEGHTASRIDEFPLEGDVKDRLIQAVREKKEPHIAGQIFEKLSEASRIKRVLGHPDDEQRFPGVAAIVNNRTVTIKDLGEETIRRQGKEVLESVIGRVILEQNCQKYNVKVTQGDMNAEVARAAQAMDIVDADGNPLIEEWLKTVEAEQGLKPDRYMDDIVWPTVALKKFVLTVVGTITVTEADLEQGFDANYGPRAECLAIVLNNQRTATEVWEMARERPNEVYFGQLARKYSVESQSSSLLGEIPPIQKHGGKPLLEKEAFALKPGEISGVIQVADKFVILYCRGFTRQEATKFEEVRDRIHNDLYEKKLRIEMAKAYERMMDAARYDNFLSNEHHAPKTAQGTGTKPGAGPTAPPATGSPPTSASSTPETARKHTPATAPKPAPQPAKKPGTPAKG